MLNSARDCASKAGVPAKTAMSIRIDDDVMDWFRSQGKGWRTRMNPVLRAHAKAHGGVKWRAPALS